jgi:hypothetical protein
MPLVRWRHINQARLPKATPQRNGFERHAADLAGFAGIIRRDCGIANSMFDPMLRKFGKIIGAFASMR